MNQVLLDKLTKLKSEIENSSEVKELNRLNNLVENDDDVMKLCYKKDLAITYYEDALKHFGDKSNEATNAQKKLHQAKLALDENELVKQYNKQYKKVREMYDKINKEIFNPFN